MPGKTLIRNLKDVTPRTGTPGHEGVANYRLLATGPGEALYLTIAMDEMVPGGVVSPHYHTGAPTFDHAFYVASGRIEVKLGDGTSKVVGKGTVIYCPSDVSHALKNVGKTKAQVLRIGASATGEQGKTVHL
ncbi:MAG: cupin domain-containing protein [Chloroflexi bacterium]|nr:cupin domain-containing protein [Chloroflexota bacterium]